MDIERNLRRLATVPRWVVVPTIKQQSVAEHTFHVIWICRWLYFRLDISLSDAEFNELLIMAVTHDQDEAETGDHPSPSKRRNPAEVFTKQKCILKIADTLEAMLFVREEEELGNRSMGPIWEDLIKNGNIWVDRAQQTSLLNVPTIEVLFDHLWSKVRPDLHPTLLMGRSDET